ncbi:hypothetical protein C8J27_1095 [Rhodobacter aestuarii]|uniref:Uncharacterized protein n=1 Tax=Rhodobacter aestuarii TaxID=453582 RepID=A0A1N7PWI9_9RHOB|nr:hypothetical protein [Rhodobacter aestuarii]PTV94108.1 hypothetical protein C8J27_1095 [Rhodobacter aestuarii]SIT14968.1 hypothetical protein SAMN05421580_111130 [Rhodobacter aestuarii]
MNSVHSLICATGRVLLYSVYLLGEGMSIMIKSNLRKLWADGEGRLLLTNIANQLDNGVIGHKDIAPFLRRARHREADFSTRGSALAYTQRDLDRPGPPSGVLKGPLCTQIVDDTFVLRVTSFDLIIRSIFFLKNDELHQNILTDLNTLLHRDISDEDARHADDGIKGYLNKYAMDGGAPSRWSLPPEVAALSPVACRFGERSIRLEDKAKGKPVFVAPVVKGGRTLVPLFQSLNACGIADDFRDRLGLDYLDRFYVDKRTVIGGILFRKSQIVGSTVHRPTPFDNTSPARFRGAYGAYGAGRGSMGRAADLALAGGGAATGPGCAELVAQDGHFAPNDSEVLIFYFGPVKNPRNDHYQAGHWGTEDDAFADGCLGRERRTRALARIVLAARRVGR